MSSVLSLAVHMSLFSEAEKMSTHSSADLSVAALAVAKQLKLNFQYTPGE